MNRLLLVGLALFSGAATAAAQQRPADKDQIPAEYKPPKGMCRIWLKGVPAKQQPAPTDCAAAVKNVPPNGRVVFGDPVDKKKPTADTLPSPVKGYPGKISPPPVKPIKPPFR